MNKRKSISILIGLLLLSGGTALGTKAWLTQTKDISNDLIITTGKFDLHVDESPNWQVINNDNTEINNGVTGNGFTNVRPGDQFKKSITITNTGTLKQKLTVTNPDFTIKNTDESNISIFDISHDAINKIHNQTIEPGKSKTFDILVKTNEHIMDKDNHTGISINLKDLINPITIEGNQVNKATN